MAMTASEIDAHVGRRMRQRREALGVSQGRLGRHLGLTFSQVQKYEKGTNRIGAGRLYLLADFLGVPVQYFFEGLEGGPAAANGNGRTRRKVPSSPRSTRRSCPSPMSTRVSRFSRSSARLRRRRTRRDGGGSAPADRRIGPAPCAERPDRPHARTVRMGQPALRQTVARPGPRAATAAAPAS